MLTIKVPPFSSKPTHPNHRTMHFSPSTLLLLSVLCASTLAKSTPANSALKARYIDAGQPAYLNFAANGRADCSDPALPITPIYYNQRFQYNIAALSYNRSLNSDKQLDFSAAAPKSSTSSFAAPTGLAEDPDAGQTEPLYAQFLYTATGDQKEGVICYPLPENPNGDGWVSLASGALLSFHG